VCARTAILCWHPVRPQATCQLSNCLCRSRAHLRAPHATRARSAPSVGASLQLTSLAASPANRRSQSNTCAQPAQARAGSAACIHMCFLCRRMMALPAYLHFGARAGRQLRPDQAVNHVEPVGRTLHSTAQHAAHRRQCQHSPPTCSSLPARCSENATGTGMHRPTETMPALLTSTRQRVNLSGKALHTSPSARPPICMQQQAQPLALSHKLLHGCWPQALGCAHAMMMLACKPVTPSAVVSSQLLP
jgi:hypothetical protein